MELGVWETSTSITGLLTMALLKNEAIMGVSFDSRRVSVEGSDTLFCVINNSIIVKNNLSGGPR